MRSIHPIATLIAVLSLAVAQGCKKDEPKPPTTPPPAESQAPVQPTTAQSTQSAPAPSEPTTPGETSASTTSATPTLKSVTPPTTEAAAKAAPDAASGAVDGPKIYQTFCQSCHGATGAGDGPAAVALNPKPANFATDAFRLDPNGNSTKGEVEDIVAVIRDGAAKYGGSPLMAPWPTLTDEQKGAVAKYVKSLNKR